MQKELKVRLSSAAGGLDRETNPEATDLQGNAIFNPNDYTDALNMRSKSSQVGKSVGKETILGNIYIDSLGTVTAQTQMTYVYGTDNAGNATNITVIVYDADGVELLNNSVGIGSGTIHDILNQVATWIDALADFTAVNAADEYVNVNNSAYDSYSIVFQQSEGASATPLYMQSVITQREAITTAQAGILTPIGGLDIGGDLIILSAVTPEGGVGEIGVQLYNGHAYSYVTLLRSVGLNLGTNHYADVTGENTQNRLNIYYTDDYNVPKYFTYVGQTSGDFYVANGAVSITTFPTAPPNPNFYKYGKIDTQTQRKKFYGNANAVYSSQDQSGGTLISGDYRYAVQPLDSSFNSAGITPLSGIVNVFPANLNGDANLLCGGSGLDPADHANYNTDKANILNISGIDPDIFPYFNLVVVQYTGLAATVYSVGRFTSQGGTFSVTHNGNETKTTIDVAELSLPNLEILHELNNVIIQSRLLESNVVLRADIDLSTEFLLLSAAWKTKIQEIDSEVVYADNTGVGFENGGYFDPYNTSTYLGYMDSETYRFGGVVHFKNGSYTKTYYIGDITIDPMDDAGSGTYGCALARDDGAELNGFTRVRGVNIDTGDWTNFWAAIAARTDISLSEIDYVEIVRRECINEVLYCGYALQTDLMLNVGATYYYDVAYSGSGYTVYKNLVHLIIPELQLTNGSLYYQTGDTFKYRNVAMTPNGLSFDSGTDLCYTTAKSYANNAADYTTLTDINSLTLLKPSGNTTTAVDRISSTDNITVTQTYAPGSTLIFVPAIVQSSDPTKCTYNYVQPSQYLMAVTTAMNNESFFQYIRTLNNKYGDANQGTYITTEARQAVSDTADLLVFGGDTIIHRYATRTNNRFIASAGGYKNQMYANIFFTMSRINGAMRMNKTGGYKYPFNLPVGATWHDRVFNWLNQQAYEGYEYDQSYTPKNNQQTYVAFDPVTVTNNNLPVRIYYSESKPQGSIIDYYNQTLQDNYIDLFLTNGEISHMANVNDQLFTWQKLAFMIQNYNNQGAININTPQGTETAVLIGDGSVLGRTGYTVSNIGSDRKWSVVNGVSREGKDTVSWHNAYFGQFMKYDANGAIDISAQKMDMWLWSNTRIAAFYSGWNTNISPNVPIVTDTDYSKVANPDLHRSCLAVYDKYYNEFKWTFNAVKTEVCTEGTVYWTSTNTYTKGAVCLHNITGDANAAPVTLDVQGYANIAQVYRALEDTTGDEPNQSGLIWEVVPLTDNTVYNYYTIVYSVDDARWFFEETPKPNIYLPWMSSYVTPAPANRTEGFFDTGIYGSKTSISDLYLHDDGVPCEWYTSRNVTDAHTTTPIDLHATSDPYVLSGADSQAFTNFPPVGWVVIYNNISYAVRQFITGTPNTIVLYQPFQGGGYYQLTGTTHSGTNVIDMADTTGLVVGMIVTGTGIHSGTITITAITPDVSITVSNTCTANGTVTLTFVEVFSFDYKFVWSEEPYIEYLFNDAPPKYKSMKATQYHSDEPIKVEFTTEELSSFLIDRNPNASNTSDFHARDNYYIAAVRNNTTTTDNTGAGERMRATWMKSKIKFGIGAIYSIRDFILKYIPNQRDYTR